MSLYEIIISRRSIRQFKSDPISNRTLEKIVDAARMAPSGANLQPLEFIIVENEDVRGRIFPCLKWAAYIKPEGNPKPGNEPMAYVVILVNSEIRKKEYEHDTGAAVENMILLAWEYAIGSCWLASINRDKIREILDIPEKYIVDSVLALGYPAEKPVIEEKKDSIKYWKDTGGRLHVPKRKLGDIIHYNKF